MNKYILTLQAVLLANILNTAELPIEFNNYKLTLRLDDKEPLSLETYEEIVDTAHKENRSAFFMAIPKKDSQGNENGYDTFDGNFLMPIILADRAPKNPCNQTPISNGCAFYLRKEKNRIKEDAFFSFSIDTESNNEEDRNFFNLYYNAYCPEGFSFPGKQEDPKKKIHAQNRLAKIFLKEKEYKKAITLLKLIKKNPTTPLAVKQYACLKIGECRAKGLGCKKNKYRAKKYLKLCSSVRGRGSSFPLRKRADKLLKK